MSFSRSYLRELGYLSAPWHVRAVCRLRGHQEFTCIVGIDNISPVYGRRCHRCGVSLDYSLGAAS